MHHPGAYRVRLAAQQARFCRASTNAEWCVHWPNHEGTSVVHSVGTTASVWWIHWLERSTQPCRAPSQLALLTLEAEASVTVLDLAVHP